MTDTSITRDDVRGRACVDQLSLVDPQEALKVARANQHPWYRCQSLSKVAEHWGTKPQKLELLEEALGVAQMQEEINRVITVSAWPLRVMVGTAQDAVVHHLHRLVDLSDAESHTLRRADGLFMLCSAVKDDPALLAIAVPALVQALLGGRGWRIDRLIRSTVEMVKGPMPEVVDQLVTHHAEGSKKRALIASLRKSGA